MNKIMLVVLASVLLSGCHGKALRYDSEDVINKRTYLNELEKCFKDSEWIGSEKFGKCTADSFNIALKK